METIQKLKKQHKDKTTHNFLSFFFFFGCAAACRILVPQPGIEPVPPAVEAWSPNHWTTREVPIQRSYGNIYMT